MHQFNLSSIQMCFKFSYLRILSKGEFIMKKAERQWLQNILHLSCKDFDRLVQINKTLVNIGCRFASVNMSSHQEKINYTNQNKLCKEASNILHKYGFWFYHQTDPRGAAVYAIDQASTLKKYKEYLNAQNHSHHLLDTTVTTNTINTSFSHVESLEEFISCRYTTLGYCIY